MTDKPQWARDLAQAIFLAETRSNGGMMEGGYGFLSPTLKAAYEKLAVETVEASKMLGRPDR